MGTMWFSGKPGFPVRQIVLGFLVWDKNPVSLGLWRHSRPKHTMFAIKEHDSVAEFSVQKMEW